ncbi:hypothetical protein [Nocardioides luteus]|uniref:hypothetical protein n=1 Tax=Nocardioides luteus TaxID=1844 RepID=UPI0018CBDC3A|nr:hypothetical protein [Nocardioides luteus]MBG6099075.1 hypothetical protein [Nocardioides luteus]
MARPKLTNLISNLEDTAPDPVEASTEPGDETPAEDPGSAPALQSVPSAAGEAPVETPVVVEMAEPKPAPAPKKQNSAKPATKTKTAKAAPIVEGDGPRYLKLTRKEARFTDEQLDGLTVLTRRLNKRRGGAGERFTDNTLIRVAVDLLLSEADTLLAGGVATTEDEIRGLLGVPKATCG